MLNLLYYNLIKAARNNYTGTVRQILTDHEDEIDQGAPDFEISDKLADELEEYIY